MSLFLFLSAFAREILIDEATCNEDGTYEECGDGICFTVRVTSEEVAPEATKTTKPVVQKATPRKAPAATTEAPYCSGPNAPVPVVTDQHGDPIILGALDKMQIDAVIKLNMSQLNYCYARELEQSPDIGGKLTTKFVIARDGTVSSATTKCSDLDNAVVENCINAKFMKMQFPEPKGGGIVITNYPLIFSPGTKDNDETAPRPVLPGMARPIRP